VSRKDHRKKGADLRAQVKLPPLEELAPGFRDLVTDLAYGGIWARSELAVSDRMICTLSALTLLQRLPHLRRYIGAALDSEMPPRSIAEVIIQCGLYGGYPIAETALEILQEVLAERRTVLGKDADDTDSLDDLETHGQAIMEDLHGAQSKAGYADPDNAFTGGLYQLAVQFGYGVIWRRPGLDRRQRMLCSLASFSVLGLESTFRKFATSAINVGLEVSEIIEAVMQTAPYAGFPRALQMLTILGEVYGHGKTRETEATE
jgi:4-carboxymuconolactone decarboxylase